MKLKAYINDRKESGIFTYSFSLLIDNILNIDPDILAKAWDGDAASQLFLGNAYFGAVYAKDNCSNAFTWIHRSVEQGNMEA
jgi:TPR repeat protein